MKRHNDITTIILLASLLLAACGSDGYDSFDDQPQNVAEGASPKEITIKTDITSMQTRATTIDDDADLQDYDLKIDAYFHDRETKYLDGTKLHYDSSWKFWDGAAQLHYYWPIEGSVYNPASDNITVSSLDFVGFCPFTKPAYIGDPTYAPATGVSFSCNMSSYMTLAQQASMQEFLVAVLNEQTLATQTAAGGALPLQFKHPFALIKFTITATSGTNVQINSISIAGLNTNATCTYDGSAMTWSGHSGSDDMMIAQTLKNGGTTETTKYMVIPKNYSTKALTVNATWDYWSNPVTHDVTADVNFDWQAGYIYTYNLTLEKYALKVETTETYTEQW